MAEPFHEAAILPDDYAKGARGGGGFMTRISTMSSGKEKRNIDWQDARIVLTVGFGLRSIALVRGLINFHRARFGRAYGFRVVDWMDFEVPFPGFSDQVISAGDGTADPIQIVKSYEDAGSGQVRRITKPIDDGTIRVTINGVAKTEDTHYTVDYTTGLLTPLAPVPIGDEVAVHYCKFHVPMRFDVDQVDVSLEQISSGTWDGIKLVELLP